jgi:hypothetical protein
MTSILIRDCLDTLEVKTLFIEPGSPWENGYVESFNGRLRNEFSNEEISYTLREAQILIESRRREYNGFRPHSSLGYRPPAPETIVQLPKNWASKSLEDGRDSNLEGGRRLDTGQPEGSRSFIAKSSQPVVPGETR